MLRSRPVRPRPSTSTAASDGAEARPRPLQAACVGAVLAAVIILASSQGDVSRMTTGDGLIYRYVAMNLDTDPADIDPVVKERGTSLRYGRIGLPAAIWVLSAGRPSLMRYVQPLVMVAAAAAAAAAAAMLFPGAGPLAALLPFAAPGFIVALAGGFAETMAIALALWAVWCALGRRWGWCAIVLCAAILTRENAGFVLIGLAVWMLVRGTPGGLPFLAASLVPVAGWYAFVRARYGHVPPLDPYLRVTTDTVGTPGAALVRSFTDAPSAGGAVTAGLHVAAALAGLALARRSLFGLIAAITAFQVFASGPFAWRFIGEAARTGVFLQLFVLLAILAWRRPAWAVRDAIA